MLKGLDTCHDLTCRNLKFRDFKHGDFPRVLEYLNSVDWDNETGDSDPGAALDSLYRHINHAIDAYIPIRAVARSSFPRWFSPGLKSLIRQKKRAHRVFKRSCDYGDYLIFSNLRSKCKRALARDHRNYIDSVENTVSDNVSNFWKFVNTKRGVHGIPNEVHLDCDSASSHAAVANLFADFFGSVYTPLNGGLPAQIPGPRPLVLMSTYTLLPSLLDKFILSSSHLIRQRVLVTTESLRYF